MCTATWSSTQAAITPEVMQTRRPLPPRRLRAWLLTNYRIGSAHVVVGRQSCSMERMLRRLHVRQGVLLGAGNPGGRRLPDGRNRRRHQALMEHVRRLRWQAGEGVGRGWRETHLLLGCPPSQARPLARLFQQAGFVVVGLRQRAELVLLPGPTIRRPASGPRRGV